MEKGTKRKASNKKNHYFDNEYYTKIWTEYLTNKELSQERKDEIRSEVVLASMEIAKNVIRMNKLNQYTPEEDLIQDACFKVLKDFDKFNPSIQGKKNPSGSAFVFLTTIIKFYLLTQTYKARKHLYSKVTPPSVIYDSPTYNEESNLDYFCQNSSLVDSEQTVDDHVANLFHIMISILSENQMGKDILEFLHIKKSTVEGVVPLEEVFSGITNGLSKEKMKQNRLSLKNLYHFLMTEKGYKMKDISDYIKMNQKILKEYMKEGK